MMNEMVVGVSVQLHNQYSYGERKRQGQDFAASNYRCTGEAYSMPLVSDGDLIV